jgi:hypothetical protein
MSGVSGISLGLLLGWPEIAVAGAATLVGALLVTLLLLGRAMTIGAVAPRVSSNRLG